MNDKIQKYFKEYLMIKGEDRPYLITPMGTLFLDELFKDEEVVSPRADIDDEAIQCVVEFFEKELCGPGNSGKTLVLSAPPQEMKELPLVTTVNKVRALHGWGPLEGGDRLFVLSPTGLVFLDEATADFIGPNCDDDAVQRVAEFFDKKLRGEGQRKSLILSAPPDSQIASTAHAIKGEIYSGSTAFNESTKNLALIHKNLALTQAEIEGLTLGTLPPGGMCLECRLTPPNVYRNTDGTLCFCKSCHRKMTGKKE